MAYSFPSAVTHCETQNLSKADERNCLLKQQIALEKIDELVLDRSHSGDFGDVADKCLNESGGDYASALVCVTRASQNVSPDPDARARMEANRVCEEYFPNDAVMRLSCVKQQMAASEELKALGMD